jgi:hypothetical protein
MQRVLASEGGDIAICDQSDSTDPLLLAAWGGADLARVDLDGNAGWTTGGEGPSGESLRSLVWSPRPGVVFEITTDDPDRSTADLVTLALATSPMDADEWDAHYAD